MDPTHRHSHPIINIPHQRLMHFFFNALHFFFWIFFLFAMKFLLPPEMPLLSFHPCSFDFSSLSLAWSLRASPVHPYPSYIFSTQNFPCYYLHLLTIHFLLIAFYI